MASGRIDGNLDPVEIHEVLSNERRQLVIILLRDASDPMSARELSEQIAQEETGESPPPRNIRQSAYVSLHQTHLPKLDDMGIVDYDEGSKTVTLKDAAESQVSEYMETVPDDQLSWSEYFLGVAIIGLLLVIAADIGVPVIASVQAATWASVTLILIVASGIYQGITRQNLVIDRLRNVWTMVTVSLLSYFT